MPRHTLLFYRNLSKFLSFSSSTVTSLQMNFHYLALFVCHLFGDGNFRTVHIVFQPNTFNYTLLEHIDTICPHLVPFYLTDITQTWDFPWNENDNPNNVLQLMFLDAKKFTKDTRELKYFFALYRIFAFLGTDVVETKTRTSIARRLYRFTGSNNLNLIFDSRNVFVFNDFAAQHTKPMFTVNEGTNFTRYNLFDQTFGHYERMLSISIKIVDAQLSLYGIRLRIQGRLDYDSIYCISNYFNLFLNKTCIDFIWLRVINGRIVSKDLTLILDHPKYYKEFSCTFKLIPHDNNQIT